jgi:RNA polymerase sigma-70 factor (ECF subfamily)
MLPALERQLVLAMDSARTAWPGLAMDELAFIDHLAGRVSPHAAEAALEVASLHVGDLFLAWSCASGERAALLAFDRVYLARLPAEQRQEVFDRLFSGEPRERKIHQYAGRAPLERWVSVVARNARLSQHRDAARTRPVDESVLEHLFAAPTAPDNEVVRHTYGAIIAEALSVALARLRPRERRVLQLVLVKQMSLAKVGQLFGVHASTVWHWVEKVRVELREDIEQHLRARDIAATDLASIVRALRSRIDVGLSETSRP